MKRIVAAFAVLAIREPLRMTLLALGLKRAMHDNPACFEGGIASASIQLVIDEYITNQQGAQHA